jgi:hypothetical protein
LSTSESFRPLCNQHRYPTHNRIAPPATCADQVRWFRAQIPKAGWTRQLPGKGRVKRKLLVAWGFHQYGPLLNSAIGFPVKPYIRRHYAPLRMAGKLALNALCGAALGKLIRHADAVEDGAIV